MLFVLPKKSLFLLYFLVQIKKTGLLCRISPKCYIRYTMCIMHFHSAFKVSHYTLTVFVCRLVLKYVFQTSIKLVQWPTYGYFYMCYIRYRTSNAQIKARVKYKVCQYDMLKNTENDKKHNTKVLKKVFILFQ